MEKIIEKYNTFIENKVETWKARFTWRGLSGKDPKYTTGLDKFFSETGILSEMKTPKNSAELFAFADSLATSYVEWVKSKGTKYSNKEYEDMRDFCKGAIGEFFFVELLNEVKCLMVPSADDGREFVRYDFNYVSPSLKGEKDFGVDLTGVANDVPSVFQVKLWNPFGKEKVPIELYQKAICEGVLNGCIDNNQSNNVFLCWLGTEKKAYLPISSAKNYKDKIVAVGFTTLEASINNRNAIFWDGFMKHLSEIR